jgi:hypothetical protein
VDTVEGCGRMVQHGRGRCYLLKGLGMRVDELGNSNGDFPLRLCLCTVLLPSELMRLIASPSLILAH